MIALENVCLSRGDRVVLDAVTFSVKRGERVAIVGSNGAGKSTLLRLIAAIESPDTGRVTRSGRIAWVPQAYGASLFPWFSILRNVAMARSIARLPDANDVARRLCGSLVPHLAPEARARGLSGGEQQAVAIARALAWPSDVVLADEPLSAIDAAAKPHVRRVIAEELGDRGLVLVTHDTRDAEELCSRVLHLEGGHLS